MKLKYVDQAYQTDAVNAICDIFEGCEVKDSLFTIDHSSKYGGTLIAEDEAFRRFSRIIIFKCQSPSKVETLL